MGKTIGDPGDIRPLAQLMNSIQNDNRPFPSSNQVCHHLTHLLESGVPETGYESKIVVVVQV